MTKRSGGSLVAMAANSVWNILNFRMSLLRSLRAAGFSIAVLAPSEEGVEKLQAEGAEFLETPLRANGTAPLAEAKLLLRYVRILHRIKPIAFLGFTPKPNIYGSIAASRLGVPVINNVTGLGTAFIDGSRLEGLVTTLYRLALRRSEAVFFHNDDDMELFLSRGLVVREQARVIAGSGVDIERFRPSPLPSGDSAIRFLFVGRLLREKGIGEFIEAAKIVRGEFPAARFSVLGGLADDPRAVTRDELDGWAADGLVDYLGTTDDVRDPIAACDCVVLPSYREGLPRVLLEGGAMGRPAIAADVPGSRRAVIDGETGFLCKVRSGASLAGAMLRMAHLPPSMRQQMGARARALVVEQFDERRVSEAYLDVLRQLPSRSA